MNNDTLKYTDEEEEEAEKARALESGSVHREKKVRQKDLPDWKYPLSISLPPIMNIWVPTILLLSLRDGRLDSL